jgi:[ribosomal protein S5]-alanine N-acetyltransferase
MTLALKSPRLLLRDFTLEDWQDVHAYASQPEACRFQAWGPNTPEESRAYVEGVVALMQARPRTGFHLAVVFPPTGTVIRSCLLLCVASSLLPAFKFKKCRIRWQLLL